MGYGIDWVFTKGLLNRSPDAKDYPCWMISALVITAFGYIIPTFIVFSAEVSSRSVFLRTRISEEYQEPLGKFRSDALRVGSMGCLACLIATWFLLSMLRDTVDDWM